MATVLAILDTGGAGSSYGGLGLSIGQSRCKKAIWDFPKIRVPYFGQ